MVYNEKDLKYALEIIEEKLQECLQKARSYGRDESFKEAMNRGAVKNATEFQVQIWKKGLRNNS